MRKMKNKIMAVFGVFAFAVFLQGCGTMYGISGGVKYNTMNGSDHDNNTNNGEYKGEHNYDYKNSQVLLNLNGFGRYFDMDFGFGVAQYEVDDHPGTTSQEFVKSYTGTYYGMAFVDTALSLKYPIRIQNVFLYPKAGAAVNLALLSNPDETHDFRGDIMLRGGLGLSYWFTEKKEKKYFIKAEGLYNYSIGPAFFTAVEPAKGFSIELAIGLGEFED